MDEVHGPKVHGPKVPESPQTASIETFADLFCGIGGFHYAGASLGLRCEFASDIDGSACDQYEHNFGFRPYGDIRLLNSDHVPDHDILFAGFPCQPFSIIGQRGGLEDDRGTLIFEIARILKSKQPKAFVLENVRQLTTVKGGKVLAEILAVLRDAGYACDWRILNALDYGLPHKRERTIFIGFRLPDMLSVYAWPQPKTMRKDLSDVLEATPDRRYYVSARIKKKRFAAHQTNVVPAIWHENKAGNVSSHPYSCALRAGASHNYLLVNGERRLTPREQLRLQGFPERFDVIGNDSQIRKQTGNAVPVPLMRAVIRSVVNAANKHAVLHSKRQALASELA